MAIRDTPPGTPAGGGRTATASPPRRTDRSRWNWLIAVPLVVSLAVPLYQRTTPTLIGIPFFYWYQLVAIAVGVLATVAVFRAHERRAGRDRLGDRPGGPAPGGPDGPGERPTGGPHGQGVPGAAGGGSTVRPDPASPQGER